MSVYPILLDSRPEYLQQAEAGPSLLGVPLGTGNLLQELLRQLRAVTSETATVVAGFPTDESYRTTLLGLDSRLSVLNGEQWDELPHQWEPSDWLLIVDPAWFSPEGLSGLAAEELRSHTGQATHLISTSGSTGEAREYVHLDGSGEVRRIQRYYDGVTWLQAQGACASLVSIAALRRIAPLRVNCLADLREALVRRGVPASDVCLAHGAIDLREEAGLLDLMEHSVRLSGRPAQAGGGRDARPAGIPWTHPTSNVHCTARLIGPVMVQQNSVIEKDALVIGPAVIGRNARIEHGATLAHCLVLSDGRVRARAWHQRQVIYGDPDTNYAAARARTPRRIPRNPALESGSNREGKGYRRVKRIVDCALAVCGLIVLSPLFAVVALLIKAESRGPVFFGHLREGKGGRRFNCLKFRTMFEGAHAQQRALYAKNRVDGPQFKLDDDPRVTRVGRILRATNIDELPQLLNVVAGHMSLIGPRPSPFRENQICVPWRQARLSVRPGITGLWQLCRHERETGDFHQWIHFDILYVRNMSFWLDLKILIGTVVSLGGRKSLRLAWFVRPRPREALDFLSIRPPSEPIVATLYAGPRAT